MSSQDNLTNIIFKSPFTAILAGPTQSGKTTFIVRVLKNAHNLIYPPPNRIVYCYSQPVEALHTLKNIELHNGLPDIDSFDSSYNNLIVLDDLMMECETSKQILGLFTVGSHHKNISVFMLTHNLFSQGKYSRSISLNSNYFVLFKNPRDATQINYLSRQMYPSRPKFLIEAFQDATKRNYGYLLIDLNQKSNDLYRVQADIFEKRIIYQPK